MKVTPGHQPVMPYLILKNTDAFIDFTKKVFGATEVYKGYVDNDNKVVEHAEVRINGCNIMCADVTPFFDVANANLFVYVDNADETHDKALANGSSVINEIEDKSYGRSGGFKDPFGNVWWITSLK